MWQCRSPLGPSAVTFGRNQRSPGSGDMVVWAKISLLLYPSLWKCPSESHNTNIEAIWQGDETWREGASNTISDSLKDTQYFKDKRTPQKGATNKFPLPPKNHPAPLPRPPTIPPIPLTSFLLLFLKNGSPQNPSSRSFCSFRESFLCSPFPEQPPPPH